MQRLGLTVAALLLGASSAIAADLTSSEVTSDWQGVYLGVFGGYGLGSTRLTTVNSNTSNYPDFGIGEYNEPSLKGYEIGGEVGFNSQSGDLVTGIFASVAYSNLNAETWSIDACCGSGDDKFSSLIDAVAVIGGRAGYSFGSTLLSIDGGVALADYRLKIEDENVSYDGYPQFNSYGGGEDSAILLGFALGLGADYKIDSDWSVGLNYKYMMFNASDLSAGGDSFYSNGDPRGLATYVMSPEDLRVQTISLNVKRGM